MINLFLDFHKNLVPLKTYTCEVPIDLILTYEQTGGSFISLNTQVHRHSVCMCMYVCATHRNKQIQIDRHTCIHTNTDRYMATHRHRHTDTE